MLPRTVAVVSVVALVMAAAVPTALQAQGGANPGAQGGGGIAVRGWTGRVDMPDRGQRIEQVRFIEMGGGFHITSGPHAILWNPANRATGEYSVKARFTKTPASRSTHEESYGLFIGGSDLDRGDQNYLYCVVFGSGSAMVRHRAGSETHTLMGKTADAVISRMGDRGATDEIEMWVRGGRVGCTINGKEMFSAARADMIGPGKLVSTDGIYGLRVSHNLDLHVAAFGRG